MTMFQPPKLNPVLNFIGNHFKQLHFMWIPPHHDSNKSFSGKKFQSESFNLKNGVPWLCRCQHIGMRVKQKKGSHSTSNVILTVMNEAII